MSNTFRVLGSKFEIQREKVIPAFLALQEYTINPKNWTCADGPGFYSIEAASIGVAANTVDFNQLMKVWYWRVGFNTLNGNIVEISNLTEYWGDDELMFGVIAPFVKSDSFIHIVDEYGERKYMFIDGKLEIKGLD